MIDINKKYTNKNNLPVEIYKIHDTGIYPVHGAVLYSSGWEISCWDKLGKYTPTDSLNDLVEVAPDVLEEDIKEDFELGLDLALDAGIRRYVLALREAGIDTFESCQGGKGHCFPDPTIRFNGNSAEGYRAFTAAMNCGLPVLSLRRYFQVVAGWLEGPWWEITFRTMDQT